MKILVAVNMQRYYVVLDYILHTEHFITVIHLFSSWDFVS